MGRMSAALLVLLLAVTTVVSAQAEEAFAGEWQNLKTTRNIVGARVYRAARQWMVQLLGACRPMPCVWEPVPLKFVLAPPNDGPPRAEALFSASNMRRRITLHLGEDALLVDVASNQLAVPSRGIPERRYSSTDELTRVTVTTEPLVRTRPAR